MIVQIGHSASSQSSLPPSLSFPIGLHHASSCNSPVIQFHSSAASCHSGSSGLDESNLIFVGGSSHGGVRDRHHSAASADCLLESLSVSSCGVLSTGGGCGALSTGGGGGAMSIDGGGGALSTGCGGGVLSTGSGGALSTCGGGVVLSTGGGGGALSTNGGGADGSNNCGVGGADGSNNCGVGDAHGSNNCGVGGSDVDQGGGMFLECPVCLVEKPRDDFPHIQTCHHRSCTFCLKQYFRIEIMESRVNIACPECPKLFHPNDIQTILEDDELMQKYEYFMLRRVLVVDPDTRWCPAPDCGYAVIAEGGANRPQLRCEREGCNTSFCYHCQQYWHPNKTCAAARAERSPHVRAVTVSCSQDSAEEIKCCPRCGAFITKLDDGSCNHMKCAVCGAHFCWLCLKEVSNLHYWSPSGCTLYGRNKWSHKKKVLWQLGILVCAPVGITLMAALAVPAIIICTPINVGRKIYYRYELASRRKRNLAIAGGVVASVFAGPIVAALTVGIGVPILIAYIYCVMPVSLCRIQEETYNKSSN